MSLYILTQAQTRTAYCRSGTVPGARAYKSTRPLPTRTQGEADRDIASRAISFIAFMCLCLSSTRPAPWHRRSRGSIPRRRCLSTHLSTHCCRGRAESLCSIPPCGWRLSTPWTMVIGHGHGRGPAEPADPAVRWRYRCRGCEPVGAGFPGADSRRPAGSPVPGHSRAPWHPFRPPCHPG